MDKPRSDDPSALKKHRTTTERRSDRELVVTRDFDAPVHLVFKAWTRPDLFMRWWAPKSAGVPLLACEMDVRVGGTYKVVFGHDAAQSMAFVGRYLDVVPNARLVWTNEESEGGSLTTLTFDDRGDTTRLVLHELYPSKEALDAAIEGMEGGMPEQFEQLDELLATLDAGV